MIEILSIGADARLVDCPAKCKPWTAHCIRSKSVTYSGQATNWLVHLGSGTASQYLLGINIQMIRAGEVVKIAVD
jgi:hypothetical protein